ncbi:MAG: Gfo/Idh/MocA family oxidoreductase [Deltaproteobacteria bacterium]|nr:Gfo/Idh/MocA family oxidoreductase [Deltaproteobacteria bacterium]
MDRPDSIRVGVVGLGDGGLSNLRALRMIGNVRITALCDVRQERLDAAKAEFPAARLHDRYQEFAVEPETDVVVIATPDGEHLDVAIGALGHGKRVFVEKPLATSPADVRRFAELARRYPTVLSFSEKYSFAHPIDACLAACAELGDFMTGVTTYTMWQTDRIMGGGKWRTETAYNPCAGGLSHNFMTALLFSRSPITHVRATGGILTYHDGLDRHGGFDTMEGTLRFASGRTLSWLVCLAVTGRNSTHGHRTVSHVFQFRRGALTYGATPDGDRLVVEGETIPFEPEPDVVGWPDYNVGVLYRRMHEDILESILTGQPARHTVEQGINVAAACALAFESARGDGGWREIPAALRATRSA